MTAATFGGETAAAPAAVSRRLHAVDAALPVPPTGAEQWAYLGRPRRWVLFVQACAFAPILWSLGRFAGGHVALSFFFLWIGLQVVSMGIGLGTSLRRREVTASSHEQAVAAFKAAPTPYTIDVFLPTCGEPMSVLRNTYHHVSALLDARVTVHVLDDAARPEVERAAADFGFAYLSRPNRGELKKAGNLLHAFERTHGDLILVLDADFVPSRDIFDHLLPYFADGEVGIVQSPQYFDTRREMNWLQRTAGATQELFYRWIQPSRDTLSAAICVGTSAVYRRSALEAAGGFAQIEHSEDVHTGVALARHGFRVRYVPVLVTKGLCPDEMKGFLSQQYRWATGSLSLATNRDFHTSPAFPWRRRLPYVAGFLYYVNAACATVVAMLPGGVMFWFFPDLVRPANYLPFLGALAVWLVLLPAVTHGRWRVEVLRVQTLYSYAYLIAVIDKVRGRTDGWVPTGVSGVRNPTAARALRAARIGTAFSLAFTGTGLVHASVVAGPAQVWPAYVLVALTVYVMAPLLWLPHVLGWREVAVLPVPRPRPALGVRRATT